MKQKSNIRSGGGGAMNDDKRSTLEETVSLYCGTPMLSEEEDKAVEELLQKQVDDGFVEKCRKLAAEQEKKVWRIGNFYIRKAVGIACCAALCLLLCGFGVAYGYIKSLQVEEKGDHSEVRVTYNDTDSSSRLEVIEEYHEPEWVPDGYRIERTSKKEFSYYICYISSDETDILSYSQYLPWVKMHYGVEGGTKEEVSFGKYEGEYVYDGRLNCLIVTDGYYIYGLTSGKQGKDILIKMLDGQ